MEHNSFFLYFSCAIITTTHYGGRNEMPHVQILYNLGVVAVQKAKITIKRPHVTENAAFRAALGQFTLNFYKIIG